MNEQTDSDERPGTDPEQAVVEYLTQHPDLMQRHPELLSRLQVPHPSGRGTVSLIERQVRILREQNQQLEDHIRTLVENAHANEQLSEKMHRFSIVLHKADTIEDLLKLSLDALKHQFDVDVAALRFNPEISKKLASDDPSPISDKAYAALLDTLGFGRGSCHDDLDDELLTALFGEEGASIRSCGLAALDTPHRIGLLALGSRGKDRFRPEMGTLFLERLGELMSSAIVGHGLQ